MKDLGNVEAIPKLYRRFRVIDVAAIRGSKQRKNRCGRAQDKAVEMYVCARMPLICAAVDPRATSHFPY